MLEHLENAVLQGLRDNARSDTVPPFVIELQSTLQRLHDRNNQDSRADILAQYKDGAAVFFNLSTNTDNNNNNNNNNEPTAIDLTTIQTIVYEALTGDEYWRLWQRFLQNRVLRDIDDLEVNIALSVDGPLVPDTHWEPVRSSTSTATLVVLSVCTGLLIISTVLLLFYTYRKYRQQNVDSDGNGQLCCGTSKASNETCKDDDDDDDDDDDSSIVLQQEEGASASLQDKHNQHSQGLRAGGSSGPSASAVAAAASSRKKHRKQRSVSSTTTTIVAPSLSAIEECDDEDASSTNSRPWMPTSTLHRPSRGVVMGASTAEGDDDDYDYDNGVPEHPTMAGMARTSRLQSQHSDAYQYC